MVRSPPACVGVLRPLLWLLLLLLLAASGLLWLYASNAKGMLPSAARGTDVEQHSVEMTPVASDSALAPVRSSLQADLPSDAAINICISTDTEEPFGLLALVNSTVAHSARPADLRFHLIVPSAARRRLRQVLESLFPTPGFRMYSLEVGGARSKIVRHLRRRDRDPVFVSPHRHALAYLPLVLPSGLQRVVWLHPDVLVLADLRPLYEMQLRGAPAAAVPDCSRSAALRINTTRAVLGDVLPAGACDFDGGVVLVDLQQWALLDVTSRVEYWLSRNLRAASFFGHDDAHAPLLLALLPLYAPLPAEWAIGGLGEARPRSAREEQQATALLADMGVSTVRATASRRRVVPLAVRRKPSAPRARHGDAREGELVAAKALHFSGRWKPWFRADGSISAGGGGAACVAMSSEAASPFPCADLWTPYASAGIAAVGWRQQTASEAARASLTTAIAAVAGGAPDEVETLGPPPLDADAALAPQAMIHVTIVSGDDAPYGLIGAVNSTLAHAGTTTRARLHFHVVCKPGQQASLTSKLGAAFASEVAISVVPAPDDKVAKLKPRLAQLGVEADPLDWPLLWAPHALKPDVPRTLLLSADTLVLTDVAELYHVDLRGRTAAVFEDCSTLYESVFNYEHPLFDGKHARSSCAFDASTLVLDLKAWKRDDIAGRLLDLVGTQRRTDGLYQQAKAASADLSVPALLALDKRVVRLPSRWLAKGLAREALRLSELQYWDRLWGQQGLRVPFATRPFRAAHVAFAPVRTLGDALLLRYSGGPFKPWLKRCTPALVRAAPLCGRPPRTFDCARVWRRYFSAALIPLVEGRGSGSRSACVPEGMKRMSTTDAPLARGDEQQQGQQQSREIGDGMDAADGDGHVAQDADGAAFASSARRPGARQ